MQPSKLWLLELIAPGYSFVKSWSLKLWLHPLCIEWRIYSSCDNSFLWQLRIRCFWVFPVCLLGYIIIPSSRVFIMQPSIFSQWWHYAMNIAVCLRLSASNPGYDCPFPRPWIHLTLSLIVLQGEVNGPWIFRLLSSVSNFLSLSSEMPPSGSL